MIFKINWFCLKKIQCTSLQKYDSYSLPSFSTHSDHNQTLMQQGVELPPCTWPHARACGLDRRRDRLLGVGWGRGWQAYPIHHRGKGQEWELRAWLIPKGKRKKGNGAILFYARSLLAARSLAATRQAGSSPRLSISPLRAGKENKVQPNTDTLAKPINDSSWERWAHARIVITNEKLCKIWK